MSAPQPGHYLEQCHRNKGIGGWRGLYLKFLALPPLRGMGSIIELGAGAPDFLLQCPQQKRMAVDLGDKYRSDFEKAGIAFRPFDLEQDDFNALGTHDIVVCSDVFEHLLWPERALQGIVSMTGNSGVLFSHVPNEYTLRKTISVMLGKSEGLYFHKGMNEWDDPHIRRFTDSGYRRFLERVYRYNLCITEINYKRPAKILSSVGLPVPYCLEGGPTYISTNDPGLYESLTHPAF